MPAKSRKDSMLPTGTVTFLFTDIEGSTLLWEAQPEAMQVSLARHDALVREAIVGANGYVFKAVGDAFCAAFACAPDAIAAALRVQIALGTEPWPEETPIKVRIALHTAAVETRDGDYFGPALNRVARLLATGHGGQTLLSQTTHELCRYTLPEAASLRDLGAHQLKDLARPEQVYELQHPSLHDDFPPIRSLSTHPNNLPRQLTSFVGREKEMAEIEALLATHRVLTLIGTGGSGKTRLCLQVAAESLAQFQDGAWFVELASLSDRGLVPQTVATVLGVTEEPGKSITQTLAEHVSNKRLLLLLDNCEHLLDVCAKLADTLTRQCPNVRILASSREALGIKGEQTYRVPSLSMPDRKQAQTLQTLSTYESVQLFIDRALLVRKDFRVTNQNAPALASVCCRLDGIPLAIELAAARVRALTLDEIDSKLDQRFRLLTGGSQIALPRQQTLRSLIDWSYDLLKDPEKLLLQRMSVFAGDGTLAATEQVAAGDGVVSEDIIDLLTSLADKSMVIVEQNGERSRFRLLETVRQYAREKLVESGDTAALRERHRNHFLALVEEVEAKLTGADQALWLQRLEEEHENLWAALDWSLSDTRPDEGLRLCGALRRFWITRGYLSEGREWCERALGKAGGDERASERAKALNTAGALAFYQSDYAAARARHEQSLAIRRATGHRNGIADSLGNLGAVAHEQRDYVTARALYEEALAIMLELPDTVGVANTLNNLGLVTYEQGEFAPARALHEESLAIRRKLGDRRGIADSLVNLGILTDEQGDYAAAGALYDEALVIRRELGDRGGIATLLGNMAHLAFRKEDYLTGLALGEQCLAIRRELGEREGIADSLEGFASGIAARGKPLRGAHIWGAAERLRLEIGSPLSPIQRADYERRIAAARAALGDDVAFDRAMQQGHALTLERAIELALAETVERP